MAIHLINQLKLILVAWKKRIAADRAAAENDADYVPSSPNALDSSACALLMQEAQGMLKKAFAISMLRHDARRSPNPIAANMIANSLFSAGRYNDALLVAKAALKTSDSPGLQAEAYYQIGRVHQVLGNWTEACDVLRKSIKLDEDNNLVAHSLAQVLIKTGDLEGAASVLENLVESESQNTNILSVSRG